MWFLLKSSRNKLHVRQLIWNEAKYLNDHFIFLKRCRVRWSRHRNGWDWVEKVPVLSSLQPQDRYLPLFFYFSLNYYSDSTWQKKRNGLINDTITNLAHETVAHTVTSHQRYSFWKSLDKDVIGLRELRGKQKIIPDSRRNKNKQKWMMTNTLILLTTWPYWFRQGCLLIQNIKNRWTERLREWSEKYMTSILWEQPNPTQCTWPFRNFTGTYIRDQLCYPVFCVQTISVDHSYVHFKVWIMVLYGIFWINM